MTDECYEMPREVGGEVCLVRLNSPYTSTPTVDTVVQPATTTGPPSAVVTVAGTLPHTGSDTEPLLGWAGFLVALGVGAFVIRWVMDKLADQARLRRMAGDVQRRSQPSWWDEGDDMPDPLP